MRWQASVQVRASRRWCPQWCPVPVCGSEWGGVCPLKPLGLVGAPVPGAGRARTLPGSAPPDLWAGGQRQAVLWELQPPT